MAKAKSNAGASAPAVSTASEVKTKLWYPYVDLTGFAPFLVYSGTPVELPATDPQPDNTSPWEPKGEGDLHLSFWDPDLKVWRFEPDISKASFDQLQKIATIQASTQLQIAEDALNGTYPQTERNSWPQQITEANEIIAGTNTATNTPLLTALSSARAVDLKTLANTVIEKSNAYNAAYGKMLGDYQTARDKITDAKVYADLPVIGFNYLAMLSM